MLTGQDHPDAGLNIQDHAFHEEGAPQDLLKFFGDGNGCLKAVDLGQQDGELITAQARNGVGLAQRLDQARSDLVAMRLLDRINRTGTTVVMATHDHAIVDSMRRRVIELEGGHVVRDQSRGIYGVGT